MPTVVSGVELGMPTVVLGVELGMPTVVSGVELGTPTAQLSCLPDQGRKQTDSSEIF